MIENEFLLNFTLDFFRAAKFKPDKNKKRIQTDYLPNQSVFAFFKTLVGRAGIEPATRGLLTTLAFTSHKIVLCCSLDWLITRSRSCLGVRRTVSEGFLLKFKTLKRVAC